MKKSQRGITLLEVLAAITILSIIGIVLLNSVGFTTSSFVKSDQKVEALRIAESELTVRMYAIGSSTTLPNICSTECKVVKTVNSKGSIYTVTFIETSLVATPAYNYTSPNPFVSLQAIAVMKNGGSSEQRLITVIVSWESKI